jgi:hypothetical protein
MYSLCSYFVRPDRVLERTDILTAEVSTYRDTKEWHLDHNDARTRMDPPTDTKDLQHIFDDCVRRSMNHPENIGMLARTEERPHPLYREGRSVDPTTASMPKSIKAEEQPFLPNSEKQPHLLWQNLPSDKADLNKLVLWLDRHDGEWLGDALWLRYVKIAKVVYSNRSFLMENQHRASKGVVEDTKFYPEEEEDPPIPYNILPAMQPCDEIDHLGALPHDVRVEILSYLLLPNFKTRMGDPEMVDHTLNSVALVSRSWRDQVDVFCGHALLIWKQRVRRSEASEFLALQDEPDSWVEWRALKSYTSCACMEYVFRTRTCCVLCGTNQKCLEFSASLGMMWCAQCRDPEWNLQGSDDDAVRYR